MGIFSLLVNIYYDGNDVHDHVLDQLSKGIPKEYSVIHRKLGDYEESDIAVIFGMFKKDVPISWARGIAFAKQREKNLPVVVLDSGYINRGDGPYDYYSVGLNGLNGRAEFHNENSPRDRLDKLNLEVKPWKDGKFIILCGQVPWDASVQNVNIMEWYDKALDAIANNTDKPVIFRPHPRAKMHCPKGLPRSNATFAEDCKRAHCFITYNSNSAVEAAIRGVPVFAFDKGSMAYPIANKDFGDLNKPIKPEREQWLRNLAYAQWKPEEMREAWQHLFGSLSDSILANRSPTMSSSRALPSDQPSR